jgi:hypothetical protein
VHAGAVEEQRVLEEKLDKALDEASSKVRYALDATVKPSTELEMSIRFAAEAVEYSSALFSLTYGLEDVDPEVKVDKKTDPAILVRDSAEFLRKAREVRARSPVEAYTEIRKAADYLKTAYLSQAKKSLTKRS